MLEIAGIGPGPLAGMILRDQGADVIVVNRATEVAAADPDGPRHDPQARGKQSVGLDLKHPDGVAALLRLVEGADVLIDVFRPGVAERLGFGPDICLERNPKLVYGRMTGWGQQGALAERAGHDINYIAVAGALAHIGLAGQRPTPPLNLLGDFGGGTMLLINGILAALLDVARGGDGQVVDAAMVDGVAMLMAPIYAAHSTGFWSDRRGENFLDTGAPFYDTYECADGGYLSVGALEPQFYAQLLKGLGLADEELPEQLDLEGWPVLRKRFAEVISTRTRDEWAGVFEGVDACVAPVLTMGEAPQHPHSTSRESFVTIDGITQPVPAPRFSRTRAEIAGPPYRPGQDTRDVLAQAGYSDKEITAMIDSGTAAQL